MAKTIVQEFTKGLWDEIPPFRLVLGLCPTLAVTKTVENGIGMGVAFTDSADFSKLYAPGGAFISEVKHKTFVDVNEEGTEAAAVTSVEIGLTSAGPWPIVIDRPFVFAIREDYSGTILFMGKIVDPS